MAELEVVHATGSPVTAEIEFHGVVYTIYALVHGDDVLAVEIEDKESFCRWRGEFSAKYVEDITSKTGSFKKFGVFVRMLQSALLQQSDSVFVDLLTYQDLALLKSKKQAATNTSQQQQQQALPASSKRYLILTYASEFDRVHYPLPLLQEEQPEPQRLVSVIQQLRQQLADVTAAQQQMQLQQQQQKGRGGQQAAAGGRQHYLRNNSSSSSAGLGLALPAPRSSNPADAAGSGVSDDAVLLAARLEVAAAELERERAAHRRELRHKARELQELQAELSRSRDVARDLRLKLKALEQELDTARRHREAAAAAAAQRGGGGGNHYRQGATGAAGGDRWSRGGSGYLSGSSKYPSRPLRNSSSNTGAGTSNSRGSSPASSRAQSPGYSRPWAQGSSSSSPRPPRPSSAPPKQRFDPTEYVRQKRQREQQAAAAVGRGSSSGGGSRGSSPARPASYLYGSGDRSGSSTPRGTAAASPAGRSSSRERQALAGSGSMSGRPGAACGSSGVSRQGSLDRRSSGGSGGAGYLRPTLSSSTADGVGRGSIRAAREGGSSGAGGGSSSRPGSTGRQRPGSSGSSREVLGAVYGVNSSSSGRPVGGLERQHSSGREGPGAASPGRALQGVKDKLSAFMAKQQQQQPAGPVAAVMSLPAAGPLHMAAVDSGVTCSSTAAVQAAAPAAVPPASSSSAVFQDASSEIADIDQRLHALQNFLKMAKSSVAAN